MRIRAALVLFSACAFVAGPAAAANMLFFDPASDSLAPSGQVTLTLEMDFTDSTTGGGIELSYDTAVVSLIGISFEAGFPDDPDFRCPGSSVINCPANPDFLSFGDFAGISGQHAVASLVFDAVGLGSTAISASILNAFDDGTGNALAVSVAPGSLQVVPEPASLALLGLGLLAIGTRRQPAAPRRRGPPVPGSQLASVSWWHWGSSWG